MSTPSDVMQIYGGMPASPTMVAGTAKMLADQENRKLQQAHDAQLMSMPIGGDTGGIETSRTVSTGGKNGGLNVSVKQTPKKPTKPPSVSQQKWDMMSDRQKQASLEGKLSDLAQAEKLEDDRRENLNPPQRAMNSAERLEFRAAWKANSGNQMMAGQATMPYQSAVASSVKDLNNVATMVPPQYIKMVMDPSDKWEKAVADPAVKDAIDKAAPFAFQRSHLDESLTDLISSKRQALQSNREEWERAWATYGGKKGGGGAPPAAASAPAAAPVNTIPGALQQMYR
jgi:hypothetical protein